MAKRSSLLVVVGVAVFILGAGLVLVSLHTGTGSSPTRAQTTAAYNGRTTVVITKSAVPAGTSGEALIESGRVALEPAPGRGPAPDAVTSLSTLEQQSVVHPLAAGSEITMSDLSPDAGPLAPPKGDETVAITLNSAAAGLAGYLQPGDDVDVYGNVIKKASTATATAVPCVALVAPKLPVLDVSDVVPAYRTNPANGGRTVPGTVTVLVAVTPAQAPALVYYASNEQLYLVGSHDATVAPSATCSGLVGDGTLVPVQ